MAYEEDFNGEEIEVQSAMTEIAESKYFVAFRIDKIASQCLCVGIQKEGANLDKDSYEYRHGFVLNCRNGDVYRLGQRKGYTTEPITNGSTVGLMLNMKDAELSFIIDGKNCGIASGDRRLRSGRYRAAILLMSKEDKVTLLNPRTIQHAQLGYEGLL